jgi:hypothetical protein
MVPKKRAPDSIRGGYRFSEKIMLPDKLERDNNSKIKSSRARSAPIASGRRITRPANARALVAGAVANQP